MDATTFPVEAGFRQVKLAVVAFDTAGAAAVDGIVDYHDVLDDTTPAARIAGGHQRLYLKSKYKLAVFLSGNHPGAVYSLSPSGWVDGTAAANYVDFLIRDAGGTPSDASDNNACRAILLLVDTVDDG